MEENRNREVNELYNLEMLDNMQYSKHEKIKSKPTWMHLYKWKIFQVTDGNEGLQLLQEFGSISCVPLSLSIVLKVAAYLNK